MFMLTGSANVWATLRISESLVGRAERVPLWPLSQGELYGRRETFIDDLFAGRVAQLANAPVGRTAMRYDQMLWIGLNEERAAYPPGC
ncbi:MAG: hypothetical protein FVQ78_09870 [Solirubrobacterales bacterium]|nr:hypothetical protein [Solirubrobacterales bacterium]